MLTHPLAVHITQKLPEASKGIQSAADSAKQQQQSQGQAFDQTSHELDALRVRIVQLTETAACLQGNDDNEVECRKVSHHG